MHGSIVDNIQVYILKHSRLLARWVRNDESLYLQYTDSPYGLVDFPPWGDGRTLDYKGSAEQNQSIFLTSNKVVFHCILVCVCMCVWVGGKGEEKRGIGVMSKFAIKGLVVPLIFF